MFILLAGACVLTYYFHVVLETGTIFIHYFYIPIILAALWWRRKGLAVAIFLALLIILSHIFVREEVVTANDYFRALMFIVIAFVVATLSEWIAKAQAKAEVKAKRICLKFSGIVWYIEFVCTKKVYTIFSKNSSLLTGKSFAEDFFDNVWDNARGKRIR